MSAWERLAPPALRYVERPAQVGWTLLSLFTVAAVLALVVLAGAVTAGCSGPIAPTACAVIELADNACELIVTVRDPKTGEVVRVRYPVQDVRADAAMRATQLPKAAQR